ncbi:MAG: helix-turn-helix domain-containing protein [Halobacteriales archaeon]
MSVIADVRLPATDFELGRALAIGEDERAELETLVPTGERYVPYVWIYHEESHGGIHVDHGLLAGYEVIDALDDRTLYSLDWRGEDDEFLRTLDRVHAQVLNAEGSDRAWQMELRFSTHDALSSFRTASDDADFDLTVRRIYNPTRPESSPRYGLTERQRNALALAVERGYYDIPRRVSTADVADDLDISDQATTERLRRGIRTLVEHTLLDTDGGSRRT